MEFADSLPSSMRTCSCPCGEKIKPSLFKTKAAAVCLKQGDKPIFFLRWSCWTAWAKVHPDSAGDLLSILRQQAPRQDGGRTEAADAEAEIAEIESEAAFKLDCEKFIVSSPAPSRATQGSSDIHSQEGIAIRSSLCNAGTAIQNLHGEMELHGEPSGAWRLTLTCGREVLWSAFVDLVSADVLNSFSQVMRNTESRMSKSSIVGFLAEFTNLAFKDNEADVNNLLQAIGGRSWDYVAVKGSDRQAAMISNFLLSSDPPVTLAQRVPLYIQKQSLPVLSEIVTLRSVVLVLGDGVVKGNLGQKLARYCNAIFPHDLLVIEHCGGPNGLEKHWQAGNLRSRLVIFASVCTQDAKGHFNICLQDRVFNTVSLGLPQFKKKLVRSVVISIMCQDAPSTTMELPSLTEALMKQGCGAVLQAIALVNAVDGVRFVRTLLKSFRTDNRLAEACRQARCCMMDRRVVDKEGTFLCFLPFSQGPLRVVLNFENSLGDAEDVLDG